MKLRPLKMSATNETTNRILSFLFSQGIFAWRNNTTGIPLPGGGFRPAAKTGVPDVLCISPRTGPFLAGVEIKTGKDRLRPEQEGFISSAKHVGAVVLVVKNFDDFLAQYNEL